MDVRTAAKQWLRLKCKVAGGALNTWLGRRVCAYEAGWWDSYFYRQGVSDRLTIWHATSETASRFHYASVERLLLRHFRSKACALSGARVLDIGSGAGHWVDFYSGLGAREIVAIDVSESCANHLARKYAGRHGVHVCHGGARDVLPHLGRGFDCVNAIGVMFHIVDDVEWSRTIEAVAQCLGEGGLFVVGGHFGWLGGVNVQWDQAGRVNKRLRSRHRWLRSLRDAGFSRIEIYRNHAYLRIDEPLPENSVLIATR